MPATPETFHVERSIHVDAAPRDIALWIEDFRRWSAWSPYDKADPLAQRVYSGPSRGVGAVYEWSGKKTGVGRMQMLEVRPDRIIIQLEFFKPMRAQNTAAFLLQADGAGTRLTWAVYGPKTLMSKIMGVFLSMDDLLGKDFEKGLAHLKAIAEQEQAFAA